MFESKEKKLSRDREVYQKSNSLPPTSMDNQSKSLLSNIISQEPIQPRKRKNRRFNRNKLQRLEKSIIVTANDEDNYNLVENEGPSVAHNEDTVHSNINDSVFLIRISYIRK